jgi:hypothetical protein
MSLTWRFAELEDNKRILGVFGSIIVVCPEALVLSCPLMLLEVEWLEEHEFRISGSRVDMQRSNRPAVSISRQPHRIGLSKLGNVFD